MTRIMHAPARYSVQCMQQWAGPIAIMTVNSVMRDTVYDYNIDD